MKTVRLYVFALLALVGFSFCASLAAHAQGQTIVKQGNPASRPLYIWMTNSTSGADMTGLTGSAAGTPVTLTAGVGGSISVRYSVNGATFVAGTGTIAEVAPAGTGKYAYIPSSTETASIANVLYEFSASGAYTYPISVRVDAATTDDVFARLGTPANASLAADIAGVLSGVTSSSTAISTANTSLTTLLSRITAAPPTASQITTALLTSTLNGHTLQDIFAAQGEYQLGHLVSVTPNIGLRIKTFVYVDGAITCTVVVTYSDLALTQQISSSVTFTGLP